MIWRQKLLFLGLVFGLLFGPCLALSAQSSSSDSSPLSVTLSAEDYDAIMQALEQATQTLQNNSQTIADNSRTISNSSTTILASSQLISKQSKQLTMLWIVSAVLAGVAATEAVIISIK